MTTCVPDEALLTSLQEYILRKWERKVEKASKKGYTSTNIFSLRSGDKWNGKKVGDEGRDISFLLTGKQTSFCKNCRFVPVLERIINTIPSEYRLTLWFSVDTLTDIDITWG